MSIRPNEQLAMRRLEARLAAEKQKNEQLAADKDYIAMMADIELPEHDEPEEGEDE